MAARFRSASDVTGTEAGAQADVADMPPPCSHESTPKA
ncbi:hypothetical protein L842_5428 [Mycobacterium intracellulare MIN_052511_1280]|nr:hypothetical protein L842_5428 [Mycobacterium intracellulare MIN_052511_1280]